jgi:anion-transporting  ArsA/GET3 family ATPase
VSPRSEQSPEQVIADSRVVVCVGSGGVGKTTLAAALALAAARRGRRALVLTIDPARRLADALGLGELGHEPRPIPREVLARLGVPPEGHLEAMMLDMKRTFDDLVDRFADDAAAKERILSNPIYAHVSDALAGSAEYSAMEKVYELAGREDLDLIVLDTPPSQHALDFLEAPERLIGFLDSRLVQFLLHPAFAGARFGFRLWSRGVHQVFKVLERVSGFSFLEDLSEFLLAIEGMSEGFRARAGRVRGLLFGPQTAFVLAAGPAAPSVTHATQFLERLTSSGAQVRGLVLNRLHVWPEGEPEEPEGADRERAHRVLADALAAGADAGFPADAAAEAALRTLHGYVSMVLRDRRATGALRERARRDGFFVRQVPEFDRDVHDLESLSRVEQHVFDAAAGGTVAAG